MVQSVEVDIGNLPAAVPGETLLNLRERPGVGKDMQGDPDQALRVLFEEPFQPAPGRWTVGSGG